MIYCHIRKKYFKLYATATEN